VPVRFLLLLTIVLLIDLDLNAGGYSCSVQDQTSYYAVLDSLSKDTIIITKVPADSLKDSLLSDSTQEDTLPKVKPKHKDTLKDKVKYSAEDSMMISVTGERLFLYGKANVKYQDIDLTADYIMLDMKKQEVFAKGSIDTSGKVTGSPVFKQGSETFESDSMKYNFKSGKGIIYHIYTKEGEGYLHSEETKRLNDGHINVLHGKYTTCDAKHPHFYVAMTKAIVIPEDKIVTGIAYMVVADVPIVFPFIPFGFFPNTTHRSSGILFPTYGNGGNTRGYYLNNGGWYQVLGEHADASLQVDIYSKGSWYLTLNSKYVYRYRFNGNLSVSYGVSKNNDDINAAITKEYKVIWTHNQDPKASPGQNFSANVHFSSSQYDSKNSYDPKDYLSGTQSSSINFSKHWSGLPVNLSLSANGNKNTLTRQVDLSLPTGALSVNTLYPLRKKSGTGKYKWYENISLAYNAKFDNQIHTYDSLLFRQETLNQLKNGFRHDIPLAVNFKLGKMITITPSVNYSGMIYSKYINEIVTYDRTHANTKDSLIVTYDTTHITTYIQGINPSASISFTPKLYGMFISKNENSYIMAVRHVMSPSASFSFIPDMSKISTNYYDTVYYYKDGIKKPYNVYNRYQNELYGVPYANGKSGTLSLALNNKLEMKVRPKNDTTGEPRKVSLLDNLNLSTAYHPFNTKFKWDDIAMAANTKLFKGVMNLQLNGRFSLYALDSLGLINSYQFHENKKLARLTNFSVTSGFTLKSKQGKKTGESEQKSQASDMDKQNYYDESMDYPALKNSSQYVNFDVPWSASVNYSWSYSKPGLRSTIVHTVNVNGNFSLTKKWKIIFSGGYDIKANKATSVKFDISRDLHCWEMTFSVVPFGKYAFYSFTIHAKSSLLSDVKYDKKSDYRYGY
jgi:lipopolysaccharide assembly outer membrane protein LptD (OstA)